MKPGVYLTQKKNGSVYYRVSITYHNKHISLGSFGSEAEASAVYREAKSILCDNSYLVDTDTLLTTYYKCTSSLAFDKFISLLNFRDNNIYIKTPIYLCKKYFLYFLSTDVILYFNVDDLFYFSNHKILSRGNHYYTNDYGMQVSLLTRYGIKPYAVAGRDYLFRNNNCHDFRYENILIINKYYGVTQHTKNGKNIYRTKIHINGDYVVGTYSTENEAAIAYNKAVDLLSPYIDIQYTSNYIEDISSIEYAATYNRLRLSDNLLKYIDTLK